MAGNTSAPHKRSMHALAGALVCCLLGAPATAQVFTVQPEAVDGHYLEFHATHVHLDSKPLTEKTRQQLLRILVADQGYAMRPLPRGHGGLEMQANGNLKPGGLDFVKMIQEKGISAKPGDRVVISDMKFHGDSIVFDLNGGPDRKHRFLRHISVGTNPNYTTPIVQDDANEPTGARLTLAFEGGVPEMTAEQLRELLKPLVGFGVKGPTEAYSDTLPPFLKKAILEHRVLVGMNTEMVLHALGQPTSKSRERDGSMPFEEWIYGEPPKPVQFIRINGNRVIRVETAEVGQSPVIHAENEMGDYWSTQPDPRIREVHMGDAAPPPPPTTSATAHGPAPASASQERAPAPPPTLRAPGEKLPQDDDKNMPTLGKVQMPKKTEKGTDPSPSQVPVQPTGSAPVAPPADEQPAADQPAPAPAPTPSANAPANGPTNQVLPSRPGN